MTTTLKATLFLIAIVCSACNTKQKQIPEENSTKTEQDISQKQLSRAELLIVETINAHGGERYNQAHYGFTFRDKAYTLLHNQNKSLYTVTSIKNKDTILDVLDNDKLTRTVNGKAVALSEKDYAKYHEAINSVLYFATLPYKLKDKAVNKTHEGVTMVKGKKYELLGVSFDQEGGGKDYDDKFLYWINASTKTVDYLAYSYSTNNGGVRFRTAINPRTIKGIRFQDYINYKVAVGTPLKDISAVYENGKLEELSRIITEDVVAID